MIEKEVWKMNGYLGFAIMMLIVLSILFSVIYHHYIVAMIFFLFAIVFLTTITFNRPNEAKLVTFFGHYMGTIRRTGFLCTVPFSTRTTIPLRVHSIDIKDIYVSHFPEEQYCFHLFVQYKIVDTAKASYNVNHYKSYVKIQSEAALKVLVTKQLYESDQAMKQWIETIATHLKTALTDRLALAGIEVLEANITSITSAKDLDIEKK